MALLKNTSHESDAPISLLADFRLHHRKAFDLCVTIMEAMRACGADPQEEALKAAIKKAHQLAGNELKAQNDSVLLESFIDEAISKVIREIREAATNFPLSHTGQIFLNRLEYIQKSLPDQRTGQSCTIKREYSFCLASAAHFYTSHLQSACQLPKSSLLISIAKTHNTSFPGRIIAFNGGVRFQDLEKQKHSVVKVKVFPAGVDRGCLSALPYVLMHEILCHWPQMARRVGVRPNPQSYDDPFDKDGELPEIDPFSEGWMDGLVAELLRATYTTDADPRCVEADTAEEIHRERTNSFRLPSFPDAPRIALGSDAAEWVRWLYATDRQAEPEDGDPDFRRLSCELNACDWSYEERRQGCIDIICACKAHRNWLRHDVEPTEQHKNIVGELLTFRRSRSVVQLMRVLTNR